MEKKTKKQVLPPYFLVQGLNGFRKFLLKLNRTLYPGNAVLYEQFQSFWLLPSLYVAAKLDVAACLKDGPLSAEAIAAQRSVHPVALARVLRALSAEGIFKKNKEGLFALNGRARALLDGEGSLRYMLIHHLGPNNWRTVGELMHTVQTGEEAFSKIFGTDIYGYLQDHPEAYAVFDRAMSDLSSLGLAPLLAAYPFGKYHTIADIGGGEGGLLSAILSENPEARGILFDLPEALIKAPAYLKEQGTEGRVTLIEGDFLRAVPVQADLYILKNVIHNWDDEHSALILSRIRQSMPSHAKIIIIEMIVPETGGSPTPALLDIQMLVSCHNAKERTKKEFEALVSAAGMKIGKVARTIAPVAVIEVTQAPTDNRQPITDNRQL